MRRSLPLPMEPLKRVCAQYGPKRPPLDASYLCTEPDGHEGDHVARGNFDVEGEYDRWPLSEDEKAAIAGGIGVTSHYTEGRQPCDRFDPAMDGNEYAVWSNVHECFGPYDDGGKVPGGACEGRVSFCVGCRSDHHSGGWDKCGTEAAA